MNELGPFLLETMACQAIEMLKDLWCLRSTRKTHSSLTQLGCERPKFCVALEISRLNKRCLSFYYLWLRDQDQSQVLHHCSHVRRLSPCSCSNSSSHNSRSSGALNAFSRGGARRRTDAKYTRSDSWVIRRRAVCRPEKSPSNCALIRRAAKGLRRQAWREPPSPPPAAVTLTLSPQRHQSGANGGKSGKKYTDIAHCCFFAFFSVQSTTLLL